MKVQELMTRVVYTCHPEHTLKEPARIMWDHDVGSVPVVDADWKIVGFVTDRDICMAAYTQGRAIDELSVASAMARNVHTCRPDDTIFAAEKLMRENQVHRLPVLDDEGRVVGVISINDIVREADREVARGKKNVPLHEVAQTLASINRPRSDASVPRNS